MPKEGRLRRMLVLFLGSATYALLYAFCSQIDACGVSHTGEALRRFCMAFPVAVLVLALLLYAVLPRLTLAGDRGERKPICTAGALLLIFCCYVPMFLIEYPGSFVYDTQAQAAQVASGEYNAAHPLLHTLMLRACLSLYDVLQSFELCAAVYSVLQMLLLSACFALLCASLSRMCSRRAARIALAFFCLYPAHMAFACNYTKDVLFAGFFALFFSYSLELSRMGRLGRFHTAVHVASGVLACLMRNNMVYAMAAYALLLAFCGRKGRMLAWRAALCAAMGIAVSTTLVFVLHAQTGSAAELLSVPAQQLARARTMASERLSAEECEAMDRLVKDDAYALYTPSISDPVKNRFRMDVISGNWGEAVKLWIAVGKKCPDIYRDAFLNLALPMLYPYSRYSVAAPYIEIGMPREALTVFYGQRPMTQPSRFAAAREWLKKNLFDTGADNVPVVRYLFNTGFIYWVLLLFWLYAIFCGGRDALTQMLVVLLLLPYLFGPVMQGRYLYPFICVLPLFVLRPRGETSNE